jgi:hypothetical protein
MTNCIHGSVDCNGDFLWIRGLKQTGHAHISSKGMNVYIRLDSEYEDWGKAIRECFSQKTYIEYSKDTLDKLMAEARQDNEEQFQYLQQKYGYKTKNNMYKSMMSCSLSLTKGQLKISPMKRKGPGAWNGLEDELNIILKEDAPDEIIGAAVRFAFTRCQGTGVLKVIKALFPDGEPDSLEEYLESVNSGYRKWVSDIKLEKIFYCDTNPQIVLLKRNDFALSLGFSTDKKRCFQWNIGFRTKSTEPTNYVQLDNYGGVPLLKSFVVNALEMTDDGIVVALKEAFGCGVKMEDVEDATINSNWKKFQEKS